MSNTLDLQGLKFQNLSYDRFDDNFADILIDALAGDPKALAKPEIQALGIDNIKAALQWLQTADVNGDYKELVANEGWRLMYKRKPPTPEEYLSPEWIGGQAEGLWENVHNAFVNFMDPNPLNPKRGLALSTSIGWGKDQSITSRIVIGKKIRITLQNKNVLEFESDEKVCIQEGTYQKKIFANNFLKYKNLNDIKFENCKVEKVEFRYEHKLLKDIEVGNKVLGPDGEKHRVLSIQKNGVKDVYRIKLSDGRHFDTSETHCSTVHFRNSHVRPDKKVYDTITTKYIKDHLNNYLFEIPTDDTFTWSELDFPQFQEMLPLHEYEPIDPELIIPDLEKHSDKVYIEDIQKLDKQEECWCITIDNPWGLYLTEEGCITHNSLLSNLCLSYEMILFGLMREPFRILGHSPMTSYSQPYGSLIELKDGSWIELKDIKIGAELKPVLDERSIVTDIVEQGEQETYELDFGEGKCMRCSASHNWIVWDKGLSKYVKIQTKDLIEDPSRFEVPEEEDVKRDRDLILECLHENIPLEDLGFKMMKIS